MGIPARRWEALVWVRSARQEEKEEKAEEKGDPQGKVPTTQKRGRDSDSSPLHVSRDVETRLDDDAEETLPVPKRQKTAAHSSSEDDDDDVVVGTAMDTTATAVTTAAAAQDETGTVATGKIKLQVTALQLCGLEAFSVFDAAERDEIQRLLTPPVDATAMGPLHDYHATFLHATVEEAHQRVACLRPEYYRRSEDDNNGAPPRAER